MRLLRTEMRRALHRRAVRVLIAIALLGCLIAGLAAFFTSQGADISQMRREGHPAIMTEWWNVELRDGFLSLATVFLILGGLYGGATVAGGEWRAGTITTVLTWEPRRVRLHTARTASAAILALVIATMLQLLFLGALVPAVVFHGTADGADAGYWSALAATILRTSVLTAGSATLAVSLATIARNTAFAVIAVLSWLLVMENLVRGLLPSMAEWLWAENIGIVMSWARLDDADISRGPLPAVATLVVYCGVVAVCAAVAFDRRDVSAAT